MFDVVVPMIVGAVIGYVTNWLAIKMLFWPREEKLVFGFRLPFTPGLFVRRRQQFSSSIGNLVESKFSNAEDLYSMVQRAEDQGLINKFLGNMGPIFRFAFHTYMRKVDPEDFKSDCRKVAVTMRRARVVSQTVKQKIDDMSVDDIENLVMSVVQRELRGINWVGAFLGCLIGAVQGLL